MTAQTSTPAAAMATVDCLLTMLKPDGLARWCSAAESARVRQCWADVLAWLRGADHEQLVHRDTVHAVARDAGLRSARLAQYDIRRWADQAQDVAGPALADGDGQPLADLVDELIASLGFAPAGPAFRGMLTPAAIELLYADTPVFYGDPTGRTVITPALLQGPVQIGYWSGQRHELALAVKFVVRSVLAAPPDSQMPQLSSRTRNLFHTESMPSWRRDGIRRALVR